MQAEKKAAASKTEAELGRVRATKQTKLKQVDARQAHATAAPKRQLSEARDEVKTAQRKRAEAKQLSRLVDREQAGRRSGSSAVRA